jgi:hypothetical protein
MSDKSANQAREPAKSGVGLRGPDRPQDELQDRLVSSAEKIRQALGKRATNL